jgi:bifunctional non-homologous end joining protein LigD
MPNRSSRFGFAKVLRKPPYGVMLSEHTDDDGELIFKHACKLGLEGIVSKRRDLPYRSGKVKHWIKVKNPNGPAMVRAKDGTF